jgi:glycosyltransferase involved in cell wall biosynthesis
MSRKKSIVIFTSSFPFGQNETFLENEILFLSQKFNILLVPLIKKNISDKVRKLPHNVTYTEPLIPKNHIKRIIKTIFNKSSVIPFLYDFLFIFYSKNFFKGLISWYLNLSTSRILLNSRVLKQILENDQFSALYFYWATIPISLLNANNIIFVRVHGNEIDFERNNNYIPTYSLRFVAKENVFYLPISSLNFSFLDKHFLNINLKLSRLGVYDNNLNPLTDDNIIRIVSCSNLIKLKRVHLIAEALTKIKDLVIEWVHFGNGAELDNITHLVKDFSENVSVRLMGQVPNVEVVDYYKNNSIDLFINVSLFEGVPVSLMEALSSGIPCFATDVGATREIISNYEGKIVDKDFDLNELVDFIRNIKKNSLLFNYRCNAKKKWKLLCDANLNYLKLSNYIASVIQDECQKK